MTSAWRLRFRGSLPAAPATELGPDTLALAKRFTPRVVIWLGVGGGVSSTIAEASEGRCRESIPHLSFQRSKQSRGVRLSVDIVRREALKHSDMRAQLLGYLSMNDFSKASSLELQRWSAPRFRGSFSFKKAACICNVMILVGELLERLSNNSKRNEHRYRSPKGSIAYRSNRHQIPSLHYRPQLQHYPQKQPTGHSSNSLTVGVVRVA